MTRQPSAQHDPPQDQPPAELVSALYVELRRTAAVCLRRERPNHTLQPTALVNETYLRLAAAGSVDAKGRAQFLGLAAHVMREILVDYARTRNRAKRGGGAVAVELEDVAAPEPRQTEVDLLALDQALLKLERLDNQQRRIVELRYFGGLRIEETAGVLGVSTATVKREWRAAKAWLHRELSREAGHDS